MGRRMDERRWSEPRSEIAGGESPTKIRVTDSHGEELRVGARQPCIVITEILDSAVPQSFQGRSRRFAVDYTYKVEPVGCTEILDYIERFAAEATRP